MTRASRKPFERRSRHDPAGSADSQEKLPTLERVENFLDGAWYGMEAERLWSDVVMSISEARERLDSLDPRPDHPLAIYFQAVLDELCQLTKNFADPDFLQVTRAARRRAPLLFVSRPGK